MDTNVSCQIAFGEYGQRSHLGQAGDIRHVGVVVHPSTFIGRVLVFSMLVGVGQHLRVLSHDHRCRFDAHPRVEVLSQDI
jgi:hypothetical protein